MTNPLFAAPRKSLKLDQCFFYHVYDLPGVGQVGGHWDLRDTIDDYLGHFDFTGKRALDVGTASGFLSFAMEKRGAEVVSFDAAAGRHSDIVMYHNDPEDLERIYEQQDFFLELLKNSYWFTHEKLGSRANAYYGDIHHLPRELGHFDVVMIGAFLSHLRDPLSALNSITRLGVDRLIITQQTNPSTVPTMELIPRPTGPVFPWSRFTWWNMSDGFFTNYLGVLGYQLEKRTRSRHACVAMKSHTMQEYTTYVFCKDDHPVVAEAAMEKRVVRRIAKRVLNSLRASVSRS